MNRLNLGLVIAVSMTAALSAQDGIYQSGALVAGGASPITTSLSLATGTYDIVGDVYVGGGASLTIAAGSTFRSSNGTLAIQAGAQIFAEGTKDAPITFTSTSETGAYRPDSCEEWGNLTIMGNAYVNTCRTPGNTPAPSASNTADMEGLNPPNVLDDDYGGNNDEDDKRLAVALLVPLRRPRYRSGRRAERSVARRHRPRHRHRPHRHHCEP